LNFLFSYIIRHNLWRLVALVKVKRLKKIDFFGGKETGRRVVLDTGPNKHSVAV